MSAWLGVVSREHVLRGVTLGIAMLNHGKRPPLARMSPGDTLVYYSPRTSYPDGDELKAFTAIGTVDDEEIEQLDDGDFRHWQRRVSYVQDARETPIRELAGSLDLTAQANWGYALRRGLVPLTEHDAVVIRAAMSAPASEG